MHRCPATISAHKQCFNVSQIHAGTKHTACARCADDYRASWAVQLYLPVPGVHTDLVNVEIRQVSLQHIRQKLSLRVIRTISLSWQTRLQHYNDVDSDMIDHTHLNTVWSFARRKYKNCSNAAYSFQTHLQEQILPCFSVHKRVCSC